MYVKQINGRSAISLLLAALILVIVATPVLAEEDEGGGYRAARGEPVILDDEMGFLCLKAIHPTVVTAETPAFVRATQDEGMGYVSLRGASHIPTRALAHVTDDGMGYLSLKGARQFVAPAPQPMAPTYLVVVDDEAMGYLSLKTVDDALAIARLEALAKAQ